MLATIPVLLGNEFDVNVGLKRRRRGAALQLGGSGEQGEEGEEDRQMVPELNKKSQKYLTP